jgi:hypothetical protein
MSQVQNYLYGIYKYDLRQFAYGFTEAPVVFSVSPRVLKPELA